MKRFKLNTFYKLISEHNEETVAYYYYNPDADQEGFGFNIADGGGFVPVSHLYNKTKVVELVIVPQLSGDVLDKPGKTVVTPRDIISAFAVCITRASPYTKVNNLVYILEAIRLHLITLGYPDENLVPDKYNISLYAEKSYDEIYDDLKNIRDSVPSFNKLNLAKVELDAGITDPNSPERTIKFSVIGRGITTLRDKDFIDLDACIRNVLNML